MVLVQKEIVHQNKSQEELASPMEVNREQSSYEHTKSHDLERVIKNDRGLAASNSVTK